MEVGGSSNKLGGGGWSWVEVGVRFSNTLKFSIRISLIYLSSGNLASVLHFGEVHYVYIFNFIGKF